jgi:uncharacterized protein YgiM (DUF1202 family)
MNKRIRFGALLLAVAAVFVYLLAETVVVKVKTTAVRKEPRFTAAVVATLQAGAPLEKLTAKDGWFQVKTKTGVTGWVHSSAIDTKKFDLLAMDKTMKTEASSGEIALASKGFNKQVEDAYKARNQAANFAAVDRMEALKALAADIEAFLKRGRLGEFGGAK